ncbi:DUF1427 family protein [Diaminobutyricibacter tongyongensis]
MDVLIAFSAGALVGVLYALLKVAAPAPPVIALFGLLGMWASQSLLGGLL